MNKRKINCDWLQIWLWPSIKQVFINYLSIICAFMALKVIGDSFEDIVHRNDILASIIITSVCIAWQGWKTNKYKKIRETGCAFGIIGIVVYVLLTILPHEGINVTINYTLTFWISGICFLVSLVLILLFNYDTNAKKEQDEATAFRDTKEETIRNKKVKM